MLAPAGAFHRSTNGRGHLAELAALIPDGTHSPITAMGSV
jgi:hypothetical protein